ncbi:hypothetical protein ABE504_23795 [Paenibacillus oryzisoli]|uniref:hypothetical protein n=1 Tax=Paenibacillus oryzisoli TaxID=1850517 RepID=UPI003D2AE003
MLILKGALANVNKEVSNDQLLDFLSEKLPESEIYKLSPRPGMVINAAIDWQIILSTASIVTVAQVIWTAYKKFIVPVRENGNDRAFLFITIENHNKEFKQFPIGEQFKDEEEFVKKFTEEIQKIKIASRHEDVELELSQLRDSDIWEKFQ